MKHTLEHKIACRAAQDVLNFIAASMIECGAYSLPERVIKKMTVKRIAALIETRMMEGTRGQRGISYVEINGVAQ